MVGERFVVFSVVNLAAYGIALAVECPVKRVVAHLYGQVLGGFAVYAEPLEVFQVLHYTPFAHQHHAALVVYRFGNICIGVIK